MTAERLAELQRLCEAATPGPWEANDNFVITPDGPIDVGTNNPIIGDACNDTAFIAAARTALPEALAEIARLRKELDA